MDIPEYKNELNFFARKLRNEPTPAEQILWQFLRRKQIANTRFTRQKPIGPYIVDFFAKDAKLIVELDGLQHYAETNQICDQKRDDYFKSLGLSVLRFNNIEVTKGIETVLHIIERKIEGKSLAATHGKYIQILW